MKTNASILMLLLLLACNEPAIAQTPTLEIDYPVTHDALSDPTNLIFIAGGFATFARNISEADSGKELFASANEVAILDHFINHFVVTHFVFTWIVEVGDADAQEFFGPDSLSGNGLVHSLVSGGDVYLYGDPPAVIKSASLEWTGWQFNGSKYDGTEIVRFYDTVPPNDVPPRVPEPNTLFLGLLSIPSLICFASRWKKRQHRG